MTLIGIDIEILLFIGLDINIKDIRVRKILDIVSLQILPFRYAEEKKNEGVDFVINFTNRSLSCAQNLRRAPRRKRLDLTRSIECSSAEK